jgi:tryptophan synthase beta subunit
MELARGKPKDHSIVACLSGRGDKDAAEIARLKSTSTTNR